MARPRDPALPLPRDSRRICRRSFLYPYEVEDVDGSVLRVADATLEEFSGIFSWNRSETPQSGVINAVWNQSWRENNWAPSYLVRLLTIGTLGVSPREVGDALRWHEGYVAMRDGGPEPTARLSDFHAFWTGERSDELGGVCEHSGLLCWWEAALEPGRARATAYFLQEPRDFLADGPARRVQRIWIDLSVAEELEPLVRQQFG